VAVLAGSSFISWSCQSSQSKVGLGCKIGDGCSQTQVCMGGIAGCEASEANCQPQCLDGTWQAPCPADVPQSGSACTAGGATCGYLTSASACGGSVDCYCEGGAWSCGPTCTILIEDASAETSADAGDGGSIDGTTGCEASTPFIQASNYDESCDADTDCVAISQGASCDWCALSCTNAAINREALPQYTSDTANLLQVAYQRCPSSCGGPTSTCCVAGTCEWSHATTCPYPGTSAVDAAVVVVDAGAE
jgi:hypothetical protein